MRAYCLMHVPFEGPGYIEDWFRIKGIPLKFLEMYKVAELPQTEELDFLLVMGGTMNIYEDEKYPYLKQEKEFIATCIREGKVEIRNGLVYAEKNKTILFELITEFTGI